MTEKPNPGSPEARQAGCICPAIDNHYGRGYRGMKDWFVVDDFCPVHVGDAAIRKMGESDA